MHHPLLLLIRKLCSGPHISPLPSSSSSSASESLICQTISFLRQEPCTPPTNLGPLARNSPLHAGLIVVGLSDDPDLFGHFVWLCDLSPSDGSISDALHYLTRFSRPTIFTFNTIIKGFLSRSLPALAINFFNHQMVRRGVLPNEYTLPLLTNASAQRNQACTTDVDAVGCLSTNTVSGLPKCMKICGPEEASEFIISATYGICKFKMDFSGRIMCHEQSIELLLSHKRLFIAHLVSWNESGSKFSPVLHLLFLFTCGKDRTASFVACNLWVSAILLHLLGGLCIIELFIGRLAGHFLLEVKKPSFKFEGFMQCTKFGRLLGKHNFIWCRFIFWSQQAGSVDARITFPSVMVDW